jgi:transposase
MPLYAGIDLHSNNNYIGILNHKDERVFKKRLSNSPEKVLHSLSPYKQHLRGIVVESTFNWYWIVDLLMNHGFKVHLANPAAIKQYNGIKYSDDPDDAFMLAHFLRLGILPEGYIYPKEDRPVRDLLRKRGHLMKLRSSLIHSLQCIIQRNVGKSIKGRHIKAIRQNHVEPLLNGDEDLALSGHVSKSTIDYLGRQINRIEKTVLEKVKLRDPFRYLNTISGVGKILSLTIMLETGDVGRFKGAGNFASYCRKVPSEWRTNGKLKGKGNRKNGNRHLSWAFAEAAEFARRFDPYAKKYFDRKSSKTKPRVAYSSLASKLSKAAFFIMRDQVPFDPQKLFG